MKIKYDKTTGVTLMFSASETLPALQILIAIQKVAKQDFIAKAITDIENDLKPKLLPFKNYFHICEKCFCEVDERDDNAIHLTGLVDKWKHKKCRDLKLNRPQ